MPKVYPFGDLAFARENATLLMVMHEDPDLFVCVTGSGRDAVRKRGWNLPSGGVKIFRKDFEPEKPIDAARREGFEETGISLREFSIQDQEPFPQEITALAKGMVKYGIELDEGHSDSVIQFFCELYPLRRVHDMPITTFVGRKGPRRASERVWAYTRRDYVYIAQLSGFDYEELLDNPQLRGSEGFRVKVADINKVNLETFSRGHGHVMLEYHRRRMGCNPRHQLFEKNEIRSNKPVAC